MKFLVDNSLSPLVAVGLCLVLGGIYALVALGRRVTL